MQPLETPRLLLRPFTLNDTEAYWPLVADPAILKHTGEQAQTSLDAVRHILTTRPLRDYAVYGYGRMACIEKSTGKLIGFSGLKYLEDLKEVDIGYRFLPETWGKGYATESAAAAMQQGVQLHQLKHIIGVVEPENTASVRVLLKLGLSYQRVIHLANHPIPLGLYAASFS